MNYVKSLAKQLGAEGHPRQRRRAGADLDAAAGVAAARPWRSWRSSAARRRWAARASRRNSASIYVQLAAADASYATGQVYGAAGGSGQP